MALAAVFWNVLPVALQILLGLGISAYAIVTLRNVLQPAVRSIKWQDESLCLQFADGASHNCSITTGAFVSPLYVGLRLRTSGGRRHRLGLFYWQVDPEFWRQSLIRLRQPRSP